MEKQRLSTSETTDAALKWLHETTKFPPELVFRFFEEMRLGRGNLLLAKREETLYAFLDDPMVCQLEGKDVERKASEANYTALLQYEGQSWEKQTHLTTLYHFAFALSTLWTNLSFWTPRISGFGTRTSGKSEF